MGKRMQWGPILFIIAAVFIAIGGIANVIARVTAHGTTVANIPIVKRLDPECSVGSRVAVQDASEAKDGIEGRVTLYKCIQEKPRWEPE